MNPLVRWLRRFPYPAVEIRRRYLAGIPQATPYEHTAARLVSDPFDDGMWPTPDVPERLRGPVVNGEQFAYGYTPEAAAYEQRTRPAPVVGVTFDRYLVHEADYRPEHEYDEQPSDELLTPDYHDPLGGDDKGPCNSFAPDTLGDDPRVCTTCFYSGVDHKQGKEGGE